MDEYHSEDEGAKSIASNEILGGGNISPEVLKMLQHMAPIERANKEEDEPDEIKVSSKQDPTVTFRYSMHLERILS